MKMRVAVQDRRHSPVRVRGATVNKAYYPSDVYLPRTMSTRRRERFIHAQVAWMLGTILVLALLQSLTLELFFVVSLIGFLVVTELTAPFTVTPAWRARLKWLIALGLLAFAYIVVKRILAILPPGLL